MWLRSLFGSSKLQRSSKASHNRSRKRLGYSNNAARLAVESLESRNLMAAAVLSIGDVTIVEGNTGTRFAEVMVTLSTGRNNSVTVNYSTANGSAQAGSDYTAKSGKLTFAKNETSKIIQVEVVGDRTADPDEYFRVLLTNAKGAKLADREGIVTITDDEPQISIISPDNSANEGDSDPNTLEFTVELSAAYDQTVTVNFATSNGTAEAGSDYTAHSQTVTFDAGQTSQTISVLVNDDRIVEPLDEYSFHEYFTVTLSTPSSNAAISQDTAYGYIIDDEPQIIIYDAEYYDDGYSDPLITFVVELSVPSEGVVTVDYATVDDNVSAMVGVDYASTSGTLTFDPGETTATFTVVVLDRYAYDRYFAVQFSNATGEAALLNSIAYGYLNYYYWYYDPGYGYGDGYGYYYY
jgi:hypothetical protein